MEITLKQTAQWLDSDVETVISLFLDRIGRDSGILLESAEIGGRWGRYSLAAGDFLLIANCLNGLLTLTINDPRLDALRKYDGLPYLEGLRKLMKALRIEPDQAMPEFPPITRSLYGYLGYGMAGLMENKLAGVLPPEEAEGAFGLPGNIYLFDHAYNHLVNISLMPEGTPLPTGRFQRHEGAAVEIGEETSSLGPEAYMKAVFEIKELIRQGECIQAVLASQFSASFKGELFDVYRRLRRLNPSPYMFFLKFPNQTLAVSSPEVMVSCDKGKLRLCPIAGTRPRGQNNQEDNLFEEELVSDPKEQAEHVMLVDLGRNDLGRVAAPGTVTVDRFMEVERFSHVMHLTSYLSAQLEPGLDAIEVIKAAFPAGTLAGAPKIRAMEIISQFETAARGPYGGALGWLGLDKDSVSLDLGITIRGMWAKDGRIFWEAGAGLVYDSEPDREWQECLNKSAVIKAALKQASAAKTQPAKES